MSRQKFRIQIFIDPLYGSERYVEFYASWVVKSEDGYQKLLLRPKEAITKLEFKNGQRHMVMGHWTERIKAAQLEEEADSDDPVS